MADIGDVHDVLDMIAVEFEDADEQIFKDVGAEVADVGIVVDGEAAGVEANFGGIERLKVAQFAGVGVVEFKRHLILEW
jgi:hypothetical protein